MKISPHKTPTLQIFHSNYLSTSQVSLTQINKLIILYLAMDGRRFLFTLVKLPSCKKMSACLHTDQCFTQGSLSQRDIPVNDVIPWNLLSRVLRTTRGQQCCIAPHTRNWPQVSAKTNLNLFLLLHNFPA